MDTTDLLYTKGYEIIGVYFNPNIQKYEAFEKRRFKVQKKNILMQ
jgi:predicted adenine nucleotide alpha hydrolase (AANH) superfamily ATPase